MNKLAYIFIFIVASVVLGAQTITPSVINAAGTDRQVPGTNIWIADNVGEPFVTTVNAQNLMITQGFLQPAVKDRYSLLINHVTCHDRDDGSISIVSTSDSSHTDSFIWSADACPTGNCGSKVTNLRAGTYSVTILSTYTVSANITRTDTVRKGAIEVFNSTEACKVTVYNGVTANGDGVNDTWVIDNIDQFPDNRVTVYNRWGTQVFDTRHYDNKTNFWPTSDMASKLVSTTYFYIIELGDGSKPYKGWVEFMKN